jgi:hypothetical protein
MTDLNMNKKILTLALVALFSQSNAYAIDLGHDVTIKGFGTAGLVYSDNNQADFVANKFFNPRGAGRTENISGVVDSKLGMQMDWQATSRLSFTGQAVSKQDHSNSWVPELQWAFAKFKIIPGLDIRAGRLRPAVYMLSDTLDVNYANPWIRPPTEFYSQAPVSHMEGVDLLYRLQTGPVNWLLQPFYGNTELSLNPKQTLTLKNIAGVNLVATINDFTLRAGYTYTNLSVYDGILEGVVRPTMQSLCQADYGDPVACSQLASLDPTNKMASFASIGAGWDNGNYFLTGEFSKTTTASFIADTLSGYITGGGRFGKFTPYATYSQTYNDSPTSFSGGSGPYGDYTNQIVTRLLTYNQMDQNTKTLGLRYELFSNIALKAQWDRIDTSTKKGQETTGGGLFTNGTSSFYNNGYSINLFSTSVDFIF